MKLVLSSKKIRYSAYIMRIGIGIVLLVYINEIAEFLFLNQLLLLLALLPIGITVLHIYQRWKTARWLRKTALVLSLVLNVGMLILYTACFSTYYERTYEMDRGNIRGIAAYYLCSFLWAFALFWRKEKTT